MFGTDIMLSVKYSICDCKLEDIFICKTPCDWHDIKTIKMLLYVPKCKVSEVIINLVMLLTPVMKQLKRIHYSFLRLLQVLLLLALVSAHLSLLH
jgi:hypothetical protein